MGCDCTGAVDSEQKKTRKRGGSANKANEHDKDHASIMNVSVQRRGDPVDASVPSGPGTKSNIK